MQITIGKMAYFKIGKILYYQDSMGNKDYFVVSCLDDGILYLVHATRWEIMKFKVLMPWRRLKRWAIEHREDRDG